MFSASTSWWSEGSQGVCGYLIFFHNKKWFGIIPRFPVCLEHLIQADQSYFFQMGGSDTNLRTIIPVSKGGRLNNCDLPHVAVELWEKFGLCSLMYPIGSMYGIFICIFAYICQKKQRHVGKSMHGSYGYVTLTASCTNKNLMWKTKTEIGPKKCDSLLFQPLLSCPKKTQNWRVRNFHTTFKYIYGPANYIVFVSRKYPQLVFEAGVGTYELLDSAICRSKPFFLQQSNMYLGFVWGGLVDFLPQNSSPLAFLDIVPTTTWRNI